MRSLGSFFFLVAFSCVALAQDQSSPSAANPVFREPFTLKLRIDKQHSYEQHFDKVPYVADNDVYLFAGDKFGVNLTATKDEILTATYQPDSKKADVEFKFTQEKADGGRSMMLLVVQNKLNRRLFFDALMTIPQRKEIFKTHVLPVEARLSNYESWPHPIVQLVLRNFRFSATSPNQAKADPSNPQ